MTYKNNGPLEGKANYLVVGGGRVYTGETFEASAEEVETLKNRFDISSVGDNEPKQDTGISMEESEDYENFFETEEDAFNSVSDKSTKSSKGVK